MELVDVEELPRLFVFPATSNVVIVQLATVWESLSKWVVFWARSKRMSSRPPVIQLQHLKQAGHFFNGDEVDTATRIDADETITSFLDLLRTASLDIDHARERITLEGGEDLQGAVAELQVNGLAHKTEYEVAFLARLMTVFREPRV